MFGIGHTELIIIGVVGILLFGSQLPKQAYNLAASFREFKKGLNESLDVTNNISKKDS